VQRSGDLIHTDEFLWRTYQWWYVLSAASPSSLGSLPDERKIIDLT
jgi:hypothetical protein